MVAASLAGLQRKAFIHLPLTCCTRHAHAANLWFPIQATSQLNPTNLQPPARLHRLDPHQELELALNEITPQGAVAVAAALANKKHLTK